MNGHFDDDRQVDDELFRPPTPEPQEHYEWNRHLRALDSSITELTSLLGKIQAGVEEGSMSAFFIDQIEEAKAELASAQERLTELRAQEASDEPDAIITLGGEVDSITTQLFKHIDTMRKFIAEQSVSSGSDDIPEDE